MGTLWTPSGEHQPRDEPEPTGAHTGAPTDAPTGAGPADMLSEEELAAVREMHAQIRATAVEDVIANHAAGLIQLALIHLGVATPPDERAPAPYPDLAKAGVAVDALAALVDGLGPRLGEHEAPLREALAQIQQAYVAVSDALEQAGTDSPDG